MNKIKIKETDSNDQQIKCGSFFIGFCLLVLYVSPVNDATKVPFCNIEAKLIEWQKKTEKDKISICSTTLELPKFEIYYGPESGVVWARKKFNKRWESCKNSTVK